MAKETLATRMASVEGALKAVVTNLGEINTTLKLANGGGKKPRRVEILFGFMGAMVAAQGLGITEGIRMAVIRWLSGGTG